MLPVEVKYVRLLSSRFEQFASKKVDLYNLRCPYCGDSQKYKNRARGYFYGVKGSLVYKCHNCGIGKSLGNFLKDQASDLYDEYLLESFKEGRVGRGSVPKPNFTHAKPVFRYTPGKELPTIDRLDFEHPARKYLENRRITDLNSFYYTDHFKNWVNSIHQRFDSTSHDDARIIIPLLNEDGEWIGFQGRSLDPKASLRYITIMLNENEPKIYGLDTVDKRKRVFITEGPFDSTFIRNSIAMCGSDVNLNCRGFDNLVWIYDNEPRNREIVSRIERTIDMGGKVVIFPAQIKQKDINDMVLAGHDVQDVVESNIYGGLEAKVKLNDWKKV